MKHYGDITKLKGNELPIVDVVTGGSPCQDLSVAGKRAGLAGERSGLFMEQIRLIKEMRDECVRQIQLRGTDEPIRPRYMVWENVPGAFSSNKGADFQAVLEETAKVAEGDASIPGPPGGKWPSAGCVMGNGWSIAWRLHDAQFWGVPQRRKRIALVADFGGETAPEILFERKGLSGDSEQGEQTGQEVTASVGTSVNPSSYTLKVRGGREIDSNDTEHYAVYVENHPADSRVQIKEDGVVQILSGRMKTGCENVPLLMEEPYNATTGSFMRAGNSGIAETLAARDYKDPQIVCNPVVRRLTPLEYERLQGFPDHWTDIGEWVDTKGKAHKDADSPRYKALGNSIALPFWQWMAEKMVEHLDIEHATMASLFDGIGVFPLVFSRCGVKPVWASEIEEFPIAVTKKHFPDMS